MSPVYDGHLLTLNVTLHLLGIEVRVTGTVEVLAVRREVPTKP